MIRIVYILLPLFFLLSCQQSEIVPEILEEPSDRNIEEESTDSTNMDTTIMTDTIIENMEMDSSMTDTINSALAKITGVEVSGDATQYTFSVTIKSPDTGCAQYADWWEIITVEGALLYRRILTHSHVDEQPFTRSGGPVGIEANTEIIIRTHMNNTGYGSQVFKGSVANGFGQDSLQVDFAIELQTTPPLPSDCAF